MIEDKMARIDFVTVVAAMVAGVLTEKLVAHAVETANVAVLVKVEIIEVVVVAATVGTAVKKMVMAMAADEFAEMEFEPRLATAGNLERILRSSLLVECSGSENIEAD